jgi:hypothetical protein
VARQQAQRVVVAALIEILVPSAAHIANKTTISDVLSPLCAASV